MPERQTNITSLTRGSDVTLIFTITTAVALATAKFIAKRALSEADGDAAAFKVVSTTPNADGEITAAGPPTAIVKIILDKDTTDNFVAPPSPRQVETFTYKWDLEVFDGSGKATTPAGGSIVVNERVRTATG